MIRLSLVANKGDDTPCATALQRVKLIRRNLRRVGVHPGEWSFTIERNPEESGFHAHCLQRGRSIDQDVLQDACVKAGAGWPHINAIKRKGIWTARYGLKGFGADGYGLKSFRSNGNPQDALTLNHGRLEHHSREFFAIDGEKLRVRDMEREAIAALNGHSRVAFISVTQQRANLIMDSPDLRSALIRGIHQRQVRDLRAVA
jgi:hypothetical protein